MPGVTSTNLPPHSRLSSCASCAEHTTPSSPPPRGGRSRVAAPAKRVHVEHPYAELRRRPAGAGDGVRNVVEFQVEENIETALREFFNQRRAGGSEQLLANLEPARAGFEARGERQRRVRGREIERDNDTRSVHAASP